jgi:hypothetical protein
MIAACRHFLPRSVQENARHARKIELSDATAIGAE